VCVCVCVCVSTYIPCAQTKLREHARLLRLQFTLLVPPCTLHLCGVVCGVCVCVCTHTHKESNMRASSASNLLCLAGGERYGASNGMCIHVYLHHTPKNTQTNRQTDRQTDRQTERHAHDCVHTHTHLRKRGQTQTKSPTQKQTQTQTHKKH
jgi:ABC-type nickel/cobalt efflux system permease component RcnA